MPVLERIALVAAVVFIYGLLCCYCWWCYRRNQVSDLGNSINGTDPSGSFLVAYASQSGTAAAIAKRSAAALARHTSYQLLPLNKVDETVLKNSRQALFVVSTYGEGEPPDNGVAFANRYIKASLNGTLAMDLSHLQFSVLALGDKLYQQFCAFGHQLHQGLCQLGAIPLFDPMEACASEGHRYDVLVNQWRTQLGLFDLELEESTEQTDEPSEVLWHNVEPQHWQLAGRMCLNPDSPAAPAYFIKLLPAKITSQTSYLNWQAGDIAELIFSGGQIRHYSIASLISSGAIELIVRQHQFADGSLGLGSGWLTHSAELNDSISLRIKPNPAFHAVDAATPAIFIGSGTGLAGLRGHILQRLQSTDSQNWLIFGERDPQKDVFLNDEINNWVSQGVTVSKAFSRDADNPQYVQDVMLANADEIINWYQQGAVIYVCGNRKGMAHGVDAALQQILNEQQYEELIIQQRYRRDIY